MFLNNFLSFHHQYSLNIISIPSIPISNVGGGGGSPEIFLICLLVFQSGPDSQQESYIWKFSTKISVHYFTACIQEVNNCPP